MIKVLHVVSALGGGGVERILYNYYRNIDRSKIKFDIAVHEENVGILEPKFKDLGAGVFHVTPKRKSILRNMKDLNKVIGQGKYNIVHVRQNFSSFTTLFLAFINGVPVRIVHSDGWLANEQEQPSLKSRVFRALNKLFANYFLACSVNAGKWLYGNNWVQDERNFVLNNAIDVDEFTYTNENREKCRKDWNINDEFVLLQVGRVEMDKNPDFSLDIFKEVLKKAPNSLLLFVGSGFAENEVRRMADDKAFENRVRFLGVSDKVEQIMNASDVMLFPSKHEGFGIVAIEAQATGLTVLASDKVPRETCLTDLISYLPIDKGVEIWVDKIFEVKDTIRRSRAEELEDKNFSVKKQAKDYEKWILKICKEN